MSLTQTHGKTHKEHELQHSWGELWHNLFFPEACSCWWHFIMRLENTHVLITTITRKRNTVTHGVRAYGNATSRRTCRFTLRIHLHSWLLFAHHSSFILWEQACPKSKSPFHISPEGGRSPLTAWPVRVTPSDHILKGRLIKKSGVRGSLPASRTNGNLTIFPLNTKRCLPN